MTYDYSTAEPSSFDLIPAKTQASVICAVLAGDAGTPENCFAVTKSGLYQLVLELTVTDGPYARRKIWHRLTMGAQPGVDLSKGQQTGVDISKATLRAILEASRGFAPTDDTPKAVAARKMASLRELDGLEFGVEIGIEKDKTGQYDDKNKVVKIVPVTSHGRPAQQSAPAASVAPSKKAAWA